MNVAEYETWLMSETHLFGQVIATYIWDFCCIVGAARTRGSLIALHNGQLRASVVSHLVLLTVTLRYLQR